MKKKIIFFTAFICLTILSCSKDNENINSDQVVISEEVPDTTVVSQSPKLTKWTRKITNLGYHPNRVHLAEFIINDNRIVELKIGVLSDGEYLETAVRTFSYNEKNQLYNTQTFDASYSSNTEYTYDLNDRIIKIERDDFSTGNSIVNRFLYEDNNTIELYKVLYLYDNCSISFNGLLNFDNLGNFIKFSPDNADSVLIREVNLDYDSNTNLKRKKTYSENIVSGKIYTSDENYTYTDFDSPLNSIYKNTYGGYTNFICISESLAILPMESYQYENLSHWERNISPNWISTLNKSSTTITKEYNINNTFSNNNLLINSEIYETCVDHLNSSTKNSQYIYEFEYD